MLFDTVRAETVSANVVPCRRRNPGLRLAAPQHRARKAVPIATTDRGSWRPPGWGELRRGGARAGAAGPPGEAAAR